MIVILIFFSQCSIQFPDTFKYKADFRDPFKIYSVKNVIKIKPPEFKLKGILSSSQGKKSAVIQDKKGNFYRVKEGDKIGNIKILKIKKDTVIILYYGKKFKIFRK